MIRVKHFHNVFLTLCFLFCCMGWKQARTQVSFGWGGADISFFVDLDLTGPLLRILGRTNRQWQDRTRDAHLETSREVYRVNPKNDSLRWVATYDPFTNRVEGEKEYFDWVYMYSLPHLQDDEEYWQTEQYQENENLLVRTYYPFGNRRAKTVNLWYDDKDRIKEIHIRNHFNYATPTHKLTEMGKEEMELPFRERIVFEFRDGLLREKRIYGAEELRYREVFLHDKESRIQVKTVYKMADFGEEPFLSIVYTYNEEHK